MSKVFDVVVAQTQFTDASGVATAVDVTTIAPLLRAGRYYDLEYKLFVTSTVTTRGVAFGVNGSNATAPTLIAGTSSIATATTEGTDSFYEHTLGAYDDVGAAPGDLAVAAGTLAVILLRIQPAVDVMLYPRMKPEAVAGTLRVEPYLSSCIVREL